MSKKQFVLDIPNACSLESGMCTGGRPRPEHLKKAAEQGIKVVVNFCPPSEAIDYDEASVVASLGMKYVNIPVAGAADLTRENVEKLANTLVDSGEYGVLLHCASGNRAGAMLALKARYFDDATPLEALEIGRSAGLTALEPYVTQLLNV